MISFIVRTKPIKLIHLHFVPDRDEQVLDGRDYASCLFGFLTSFDLIFKVTSVYAVHASVHV